MTVPADWNDSCGHVSVHTPPGLRLPQPTSARRPHRTDNRVLRLQTGGKSPRLTTKPAK